MDQKQLLRYGNELEISGFVLANGKESHLIMFPNTEVPLRIPSDYTTVVKPNHEEMKEILNQLDILGVEGLNKTILRKSQRQIEQNISWNVFRRDNYACRYCGDNDVPLTVDHIVLWEHMGASVEGNLLTACRKCNKTRGNMLYGDWIQSDYYKNVTQGLNRRFNSVELALKANEQFGWEAGKIPLRNTQRSR